MTAIALQLGHSVMDVVPFIWHSIIPRAWAIVEELFSRTFSVPTFSAFITAFLVNRTLVYASTREPRRPAWLASVGARMGVFAFFMWLVFNIYHEKEDVRLRLRQLMSGISTSYLVETFCTIIEHRQQNFDCGFWTFELGFIFEEIARNEPDEMSTVSRMICIVLCISQLFIQLQGLFHRLGEYRLVFSTLLSVSYFYIYGYALKSGFLFFRMNLMLSFIMRQVPQLIMMLMIVSCEVIYRLAGLAAGGVHNLTMYRPMGRTPLMWKESFSWNLLQVTVRCLMKTPDSHYLHEAELVARPWSTYLDIQDTSKTNVNPYSVKSKHQAVSRPGFVKTWFSCIRVWARLIAFQLKYRLLGKPIPVGRNSFARSIFRDYRYAELDSGDPNAWRRLLLEVEAPFIDDSADYDEDELVPDGSSHESEGESEDESFDEDELAQEAFYTTRDALSLYGPETGRHWQYSGPLTRSRWRAEQSDALEHVVRDRRSDVGEVSELNCVVCYENPRRVILWPCGCFALCDECRAALAVKGDKTCVNCRQVVKSYSHVYTP